MHQDCTSKRRAHGEGWLALLVLLHMGWALALVGCAEGMQSEPDRDALDLWTSADGSEDTAVQAEIPENCDPTSCLIGSATCGGPYALARCVDGGDGCGTLTEPVACGLAEVCEAGDCVPFSTCVDNDGDLHGDGCSGGPDCDDADASIFTGNTETCDGVDNNCNDAVDEGCADPCAGQACVVGSRRCTAAGAIEECIANLEGCGEYNAPVACTGTCTNGLCSGCVDADGDGRGDNCPLGADCADNDPQRYEGAAESCDGLDNNCDGQVDEAWTDLGDSCTAGVGACAKTGTKVCKTDASGTKCSATAGTPGAEKCGDSVDSDCDGNNDNGFGTIGQACTVGSGACAGSGTYRCDTATGTTTYCDATAATGSTEVCDGADNDCDNQTDEGGVCTSCTDDAYEQNDSSSTGTNLTTKKTITGLMSCGSDVDWFNLGTYSSSFTANLKITHPTGNNPVGAPWGNLDVEFYCPTYCSGIYVDATSGSFQNGATCCPVGNTVTARVYPRPGTQPASGTPYTLQRY